MALQIERITAEAGLDRLRPLWLQLHRYHQDVAPELSPYVDDEASWAARRALYSYVLGRGGLVAVASDGADLGYVVSGSAVPHWTATLDVPSEVTELLTLLVVPAARGRGVGTAMLKLFDAEVERSGTPAALVGVVPQNTGAIALYERHGFQPAWLTMTRFQRPRVAPPSPFAWERVEPGEVDALKPLWLQLHEHHRQIAADLGPFLSDDASWAAIRDIVAADARDGLAFRIGPAERPRAMMTGSMGRDSQVWQDTWVTAAPVAEPDVLVVDRAERATGLGSALMDIYDAALAARGATDQALAVIAPNSRAIKLYERRGFRPALLEMTRFGR